MAPRAPHNAGSRISAKLGRLLSAIENLLAVFSIAFLFLLVLIITADVVGRQVANFSMPWIVEVAEYFLLFSTFMTSAWVLREGGHISVDFFDRHLSPQGVRRLKAVAYMLTFLTALFVLWFSFQTTLRYYQRGSFQGNFVHVPQWLVYAPIPAGISLFSIELVRQISRFVGERKV